jgi:hypothetical protein
LEPPKLPALEPRIPDETTPLLNPVDFTPETEPKLPEPDPLLNPVDLTPDTPWPTPNEEAP